MKFGKFISPLRGIVAVMVAILVLSVTGYALADNWRGAVDDMLGTESYVVDDTEAEYVSDYETADEMMAAARALAVKEGEEGTVVLKNSDGALPLSTSTEVALFGLAAYAPYCASGDLQGGNADAVDLVGALTDAGFKINSDVAEVYTTAMNKHEEESQSIFGTTISTVYDIGPQTSVGDLTTFQNNEVSVDDIVKLAKTNGSTTNATGASTLSVDKDTVGIVMFERAGGESNMYSPKSVHPAQVASIDTSTKAITYTDTNKDALELSDNELGVIKTASELCSKVVVLLNTSNDMMIGDIVDGEYSQYADAIAYIGVPNDYQFEGIVNVLDGKANATGALTDTYVYDNMSLPAMQNVGGDFYADYQLVETGGETGYTDYRWDPSYVSNGVPSSSFSASDGSGSVGSYSGGQYIVEAEGIYVGYKYYETRYYDSIVDASGTKATNSAGSTSGSAWDYDKEVVYPFGYGLSYLDYEQNITKIDVDNKEDGYITATVEVTNKSDQDGYFLAELYVQQPYTDYDKTNAVEKSAIMFLNSAKVEVPAGKTEKVEIQVATKYLASYDYTEAETYILDEGTYYFTAANGSHEAVNNVIAEQNISGVQVEQKGAVKTWSLKNFDDETFSEDHDTEITNVVEDTADMNSWIPGSVTYLTRADWTTFPKNYNTTAIKLSDSSKTDEWISEIRGQTYTITATDEAPENIDGVDNGYRFTAEQINPEVKTDITNEYWDNLVNQISVNEAVGAVLHGGSQSDVLTNVDNPIVSQHEGVNGFSGAYTEGGVNYNFNISSQTLLGSSFNPELAYEWGRVEGNSGLWLQYYDLWGTGLTLRRTPYNGRNYEYISEDPMLTNVIGYGVIKGTREMGVLCGPKHIGFNDQEHNRNGVAAYMNEQKFRETDLRGFQGGLEDAEGLAVMVAFNRIGPVNASHSQGMLKSIMREEWGYKGLISTDMMNDCYYFDGVSIVMSTVTQVADFAQNNSYISSSNDHSASDSSWSYITIDYVSQDANFVAQAREDMKYQLYAFANSAVLNIKTETVMTWWDAAFVAVISVSATLFGLGAVALIVCTVFNKKNKEDEQ